MEPADRWVSVLGKEAVLVSAAPPPKYHQATTTGLIRQYLQAKSPKVWKWRAVLLVDSGVPAHIVNEVQADLRMERDANAQSNVFTVPAGEKSKTREMKQTMEDWMLKQSLGRDTLVVTVGGGMVGDLGGYVAATFLRGVPVVHVPTTLMAMVDSSVGGKTAVNVKGVGKNLIGAFHQPTLVIMRLRYLATLPKRVVAEAFAEVIKYELIDFQNTLFLPTTADGEDDGSNTRPSFPSQNVHVMSSFCRDATNDTLLPPAYFCTEPWLNLVLSCAAAKARVVSNDEKEQGLRESLNFGHTIGHAVEALMGATEEGDETSTSDGFWYHGECVAVGMVAELETSFALGLCSYGVIWKLRHLLSLCGLPQDIPFPTTRCAPHLMLEVMATDKKNRGGQKHVILLKDFGVPAHPSVFKSSAVADDVLHRVCSRGCSCNGMTAAKAGHHQSSNDTTTNNVQSIVLPGSKSVTNRALLLASLSAEPTTVKGALVADDTMLMAMALTELGVALVEVEGDDTMRVTPQWPKKLKRRHEATTTNGVSIKHIYVGNSGTTARFVLPLCCILPSWITGATHLHVSGSARMHERPVKDLLMALTNAERHSSSDGSSPMLRALGNDDCFPLEVACGSLLPAVGNSATVHRSMTVNAEKSSQFLSALLLCAPALSLFDPNSTSSFGSAPVTITTASSTIVSRPFIDLTLRMLASFGGNVEETRSPDDTYTFTVNCGCTGGLRSQDGVYVVEADATNASYFMATACLRLLSPQEERLRTLRLENVGSSAMQRDSAFAEVLQQFGFQRHIEQDSTTTTIIADGGAIHLESIDTIDMGPMTDCFMTCAVVAAVAKGTTTICGIANQREKECDRIAAMVKELRKLPNVQAEEMKDGLRITGNPQLLRQHDDNNSSSPSIPIPVIECYNDHRMAMSFSCLSMASSSAAPDEARSPLLVIEDKRCVEKTFPLFWRMSEVAFAGVRHDAATNNHGHRDASTAQPTVVNPVVVIVGMRFSGKTSLGSVAAEQLGWHFVDVDEAITKDKEMIELLGNDAPPSAVINEFGWEYFRNLECKVMEQLLDEALQGNNKQKQATIIACGGGFVDHEPSRRLLEAKLTPHSNCLVVWADKPLAAIEQCHTTMMQSKQQNPAETSTASAVRPMYNTSVAEVFHRRRPHFRRLADVHFHVSPSDFNANTTRFVQMIQELRVRMDETTSASLFTTCCSAAGSDVWNRTHFVCYAPQRRSSSVSELKKLIPSITLGVEALELRIDSLFADLPPTASADAMEHCESVQSTLDLVRHVCAATPLPIILTLRSTTEGGAFQGPLELYWNVLQDIMQQLPTMMITIPNNIVLDVEASMLHQHSQRSGVCAKLQRLMHNKLFGFAGVILSLHAPQDLVRRKAKRVVFDSVNRLNNAGYLVAIPKIVVLGATTSEDILTCKEDVVVAVDGTLPNCIFVGTGTAGIPSRLANSFLTPVTHKLLEATAPGQLTLRELNSQRLSLPLAMAPRHLDFFVCGSPVGRSKSPFIHNAVFDLMGFAATHQYGRLDTSDPAHVWSRIAAGSGQLADATASSQFGGASVTIPLKETIVPFLDGLDEDARCIGAVNTLVPCRAFPKSKGNASVGFGVVGFNTDWLGLRDALLGENTSISTAPNATPSKRAHVVLGAGGTARSAVFTLLKAFASPNDVVFVVNRTAENAVKLRMSLASAMASHGVETQRAVLDRVVVGWPHEQQGDKKHCSIVTIISTIPPTATVSGDDSTLMSLVAASASGPRLQLVDFAYTQEARSNFDIFMEKTLPKCRELSVTRVTGIDILRRQAMYQQLLWRSASRENERITNQAMPSASIEDTVASFMLPLKTCSTMGALSFPVTDHLVQLTEGAAPSK